MMLTQLANNNISNNNLGLIAVFFIRIFRPLELFITCFWIMPWSLWPHRVVIMMLWYVNGAIIIVKNHWNFLPIYVDFYVMTFVPMLEQIGVPILVPFSEGGTRVVNLYTCTTRYCICVCVRSTKYIFVLVPDLYLYYVVRSSPLLVVPLSTREYEYRVHISTVLLKNF
jgi:hypothetical protein